MAALGDIQESPSVPSPVSFSSPGTPGTQHHEPQLHLHGHQHGSPGSSPKVLSQPSDLDLQDVEEVEIGRDTFWPDGLPSAWLELCPGPLHLPLEKLPGFPLGDVSDMAGFN
ncbi:GLI4 isoform 8, partial [Pan troglodytes]